MKKVVMYIILCFFVSYLIVSDFSLLEASEKTMSKLPKELEGVTVIENLGKTIPLDLSFTDHNGRIVTINDFFKKENPVVIVMAYYTCPMLCSLVLNGVNKAIKDMDWLLGEKFDVVTVSIDPRDGTDVAREKRKNYLTEYGKIPNPEEKDIWPFLTTTSENSKILADSLGFKYKWDEYQQEYAHTAVVFVLTPNGQISRYLYGIEPSSNDMKMALLEASEGKIGNIIERFILFCYHYDPINKKYALYSIKLMQIGGFFTCLLLGFFLIKHWRREFTSSF